MRAISIPAAFALETVQREGDAGQAWLDGLPALVGSLLERWRLAVDGETMHGTVGLVLPVRRDAERLVLKVSWKDPDTAGEIGALRAWQGQGAVALLDADPEAGALLLERLDPRRTLEGVPIDEAGIVAGELLDRLAIPPPPGARIMDAMADELQEQLERASDRRGGPIPAALVERGLSELWELTPTIERVLIDYDLHYGNVLAGEREPWLVIDPKAAAGEPEFAVAPLLWNRLGDIEASGGPEPHFHRIVEAARLEADRARAWTLVRALESWAWAVSVGIAGDPERFAWVALWAI